MISNSNLSIFRCGILQYFPMQIRRCVWLTWYQGGPLYQILKCLLHRFSLSTTFQNVKWNSTPNLYQIIFSFRECVDFEKGVAWPDYDQGNLCILWIWWWSSLPSSSCGGFHLFFPVIPWYIRTAADSDRGWEYIYTALFSVLLHSVITASSLS